MPQDIGHDTVPQRRGRYPWARWADGEMRKFTQGEDFQVVPSQFVAACKKFCKRRGWIVDAVVRKDEVFLSITKPDRKTARKVPKK